MPIPFIPCRNKVTGATAEVPQTALPHMTDWVPLDQDDPDAPASAPPAAEPERQPAPRTTKPRKAADTATTETE